MSIEVETVLLPAYWASALINGDDSSFDILDDADAARERQALDTSLTMLAEDGWSVVDVKRDDDGDAAEPFFSRHYHWYHPDPGPGVTGGDLLEYVAHRNS